MVLVWFYWFIFSLFLILKWGFGGFLGGFHRSMEVMMMILLIFQQVFGLANAVEPQDGMVFGPLAATNIE